MILLSIVFLYILIERLVFFQIYSKQSKISDIEYDLSANSNSWFAIGAGNSNLLFLCDFLIFCYVWYILRFEKKQHIYHFF